MTNKERPHCDFIPFLFIHWLWDSIRSILSETCFKKWPRWCEATVLSGRQSAKAQPGRPRQTGRRSRKTLNYQACVVASCASKRLSLGRRAHGQNEGISDCRTRLENPDPLWRGPLTASANPMAPNMDAYMFSSAGCSCKWSQRKRLADSTLESAQDAAAAVTAPIPMIEM